MKERRIVLAVGVAAMISLPCSGGGHVITNCSNPSPGQQQAAAECCCEEVGQISAPQNALCQQTLGAQTRDLIPKLLGDTPNISSGEFASALGSAVAEGRYTEGGDYDDFLLATGLKTTASREVFLQYVEAGDGSVRLPAASVLTQAYRRSGQLGGWISYLDVMIEDTEGSRQQAGWVAARTNAARFSS